MNEKLLRIAGLMVILRDNLEDLNFDQKLKNLTNQWLKHAERKIDQITKGGHDANVEYYKLIDHLREVTTLESGQK
jgi:hypothetical protein